MEIFAKMSSSDEEGGFSDGIEDSWMSYGDFDSDFRPQLGSESDPDMPGTSTTRSSVDSTSSRALVLAPRGKKRSRTSDPEERGRVPRGRHPTGGTRNFLYGFLHNLR